MDAFVWDGAPAKAAVLRE